MDLSIVLAIVIPTIGGIAAIAVYHPKTYNKLYVLLGVLGGLVCLGHGLWYWGVVWAWEMNRAFIPVADQAEAEKLLDASIIEPGWSTIGLVCLVVVLTFFSWLSMHIESERKERQKSE